MGERSPDISPPSAPLGKPPLPTGDKLFRFAIGRSLLVGLTINLLPVPFKVFEKLFQAGCEQIPR